MASYKDSVITASKELTSLVERMSEQEMDPAYLRECLTELNNKINPLLNECGNDNCSIDTWKGADNICPLCQEGGTVKGRLVK